MKIHLTSHGQGKPLVFFHGWGFDSQVWLHLVPQLTENYQLFLVDLPGFGASSAMDWVCFKEQLLSQLPEQFSLIGWSMGGLYATRLALEAPKRVRCLLNVASSPRFICDANWPGVAKDVFYQFHEKLATDAQATLGEFISLQTNKQDLGLMPKQLPATASLAMGLKILDSWDFRKALKTLELPVGYFFGRLDPITSVRTMRVMQKQYPNFHYVLFNKSAHMPFLSHAQSFVTHLRDFIQ